MAEISDIPYDSLLDAYQSRVRLSTLKKGKDMIEDDIAQMPIFPYYSLDMAILYGGVDGQKFEVARPTLKARRSKKYFKKGKGVVAYTLLVRAAIATAYGKKQLSGRGDREIEISKQCGRLIANAIIHYNSALLS